MARGSRSATFCAMNEGWTARELGLLRELRSPWEVQALLDGLPYSAEPIYRSPRRVLADGVAHCVDGGLFAAAALRRLGSGARVVWLVAEHDDGHLAAVV